MTRIYSILMEIPFVAFRFLYHPPTKLPEGNVFSGAYLSVRGGHCTGPQIQTHCTGVPSPDIFKLVQIGPHCTGILFPGHDKLVQQGTYCTGHFPFPPDMFKLTCST